MENNINENIVLYDWISFTSKIHTPDELIHYLGLSDVPWIETKGARGYRDRKYFGSISIHYNGREDMGIWCEMSGQGCRMFESMSKLGWDGLFSFIHGNDLNITRLDIAFDDHTGILPIDRIVDDTQAGNYVSRMNYWETVISSKGTTVQIGSPQSKLLIRIYDKARERGIDDGQHWVRCEMQLRDERAAEFTKIPMPIGQAFVGVLLNYLRFVVPGEDTNKSRWEMTDYWDDLVGNAERIRIYTAPGSDYNEERCRNYVVNQAGNAIDACIQMYGLYEFEKMINERETCSNPKYDMLVKFHKFNSLAERVKFYFGVDEDLRRTPESLLPL